MPDVDPLETVLEALRAHGAAPRSSGTGFSARCPAHEDRNPSLSVSAGRDGRALLKCQAGCTTQDVVAALGLAVTDLFPAREERKRAEIVATYDYTDEEGALLYQVVRYEPKAFRQRRPDGNSGWAWSLKGVRRPLYRLPDVLHALSKSEPIFVTEGEKDADALARQGYVATCNSGGAEKWLPEHSDALLGATQVIIVADKDPAGRQHAVAVARSLRNRADEVVIVEAVEGKDAHDHLQAGHGVDEFRVMTGGAGGTASLLEQLSAVLQRFVVWRSPRQVSFVALWVMHTYVYDLFDTSPYLDVSSAAKRSGKTRLLELLRLIVARPWQVVEPSEAVLYRKVDQDRPTLLVDEIDATFGKDSKATEGLRAVFNAGYRAGSSVARCVGNDHKAVDFNVYCPKCFAGLDGLPDTIRDRSGRIELARRSHAERKPERLRMAKVKTELEPLVDSLDFWAASVIDDLRGVEPTMPELLSDRAQDGCEVLAAIADLAGGEWPERARTAFVEIMGAEEDGDQGVQLLGHIREAFVAADTDALVPVDTMATTGLLRFLVDRGDDSPWAAWWGRDLEGNDSRRPAMRLAQMLKPYGIRSTVVWVRDSRARGYKRTDFKDAWDRYVSD